MVWTSITDAWLGMAYLLAGGWWVHRKLWTLSDPVLANKDAWWVR